MGWGHWLHSTSSVSVFVMLFGVAFERPHFFHRSSRRSCQLSYFISTAVLALLLLLHVVPRL